MSAGVIALPTSPKGAWEQLTANEKAWVEFIRVISSGRDPKLTTARIVALREMLDTG